jgi:hypothetical protein
VFLESLGIGAIGAALGALAFEAQYKGRQGNLLDLNSGIWQFEIAEPRHYRLVGQMELTNRTQKLEIMVPELWTETKILSKDSLAGVRWEAQVTPNHPDEETRPDGYWFAYIVKIGKSTQFTVTLDIYGDDLSGLESAWVKVNYVTYGPGGRVPRSRHVIIPLRFPNAEETALWRPTEVSDVLPIRTHLLTTLDTPVEVAKRYAKPQSMPGDILTIGESPIAIMQGNFRHPTDIKPGWLAKRICYYFLPTSSLATAGGMQSLVDVAGAWRVGFAFVGGIVMRLFGQRGGFYILAGEQARLVDDVTGTLPPYDQFIVGGPHNPQGVVDEIEKETGLKCAIVDVNDLGAVKVLASSPGVSQEFLEKSLRKNPAGNANEQTPVVLLRPKA